MGNQQVTVSKSQQQYLLAQKRVNDICGRMYAEMEELIKLEIPTFPSRYSEYLGSQNQTKLNRLLNVETFCEGLNLIINSHNTKDKKEEEMVKILELEYQFKKDLSAACEKLQDEQVKLLLKHLLNRCNSDFSSREKRVSEEQSGAIVSHKVRDGMIQDLITNGQDRIAHLHYYAESLAPVLNERLEQDVRDNSTIPSHVSQQTVYNTRHYPSPAGSKRYSPY